MTRSVYRISLALLAAWSLTSSPTSAQDLSARREGENRWIPSLALVLGFSTQDIDGHISSRDLGGGEAPRAPTEDHKYANALEAGGSLELLTPTLPLPLSPRFFASGEIISVSAQKRWIAREGDPGKLMGIGGSVPELAIRGQGSSMRADPDNVLYGASLGISIPARVGDWQLWIKPSARYLRRKIYFDGNLSRAFKPVNPGPTRRLWLEGRGTLDVDAVGPGLEIEIDATRIKSIAASIYINGGAYRVLSDDSIKFSGTGFDSAGSSEYEATWRADINEWMYRADVGFRLKWLGLAPGWLGRGARD